MADERSMEDELLHPDEKWYYNLVTHEVTQDPGQNRMGPYPSKEEAQHALELAKKRNEEWEAGDDEWEGRKNQA